MVNNPTVSTITAAYSFYNVATKTPLVALMEASLILAKASKHDVFNALALMDNKSFFEPLHFGPGDGHLQYYVYNYRLPPSQDCDVGLVLL